MPSLILPAEIAKDIIVGAGADAILNAIKTLPGWFGKSRLDGSYQSAEDFWYRGIEAEQLEDGAKVSITGQLSPLAPFMPSHPRAKPGYSTVGWTTVSDRLAAFMRTRTYDVPDDPLAASGYDAIDLVVWGDAVVRARVLPNDMIYAGLYNQYGKSFECVPVFLNRSSPSQRKVLAAIDWERRHGGLVKVTGTIRRMASYYDVMGLAHPIEVPGYPCYCIEASRIQSLPHQKTVLYATAWSVLDDGQVVTEFFDYMVPDEHAQGLERLKSRVAELGEPWFYYDSQRCPFANYPSGNQDLDRRLQAPG